MGVTVGSSQAKPLFQGPLDPPGPSQARQAAPLRKVPILSPVSY